MITVFEAKDYKSYLKGWIDARPKGGRGESKRIAEKLGVSTTLISQILNGDKHFTMEAANDLCDYLGSGEKETDHFLLLVEFGRAGSPGLRARINRRIHESRDRARKIAERIESERDLTDTQAAIYYSHWVYTGVTNLLATKPNVAVDDMARRLNLPTSVMARVLEFLIESGIIVRSKDGYDVGVKQMYIGADSPFVVKHH